MRNAYAFLLNIIMSLPEQAITEFAKLYHEQFGVSLPREEAAVHALALYKIYKATLI
jgi:hypothetical protein